MKEQTIKKLMKLVGCGRKEAQELVHRRTGKSTARAITFISQALNNPNEEILVTDHHNSREADKFLLKTCSRICNTLELKGFKFNQSKIAIVFDPKELQKKIWGFELV